MEQNTIRSGEERKVQGNHGLRRQVMRFGVVGILGFVVNAGILQLLASHIGPVWGQLLAFPVAATVTWWMNRKYTFGVSSNRWHVEWLRYIVANVFGWGVVNGIYFALILNYSPFYDHPWLAVTVGAAAGMFVNFSSSRWLVFK